MENFRKAGEPGWASIIPIYNTYIEFEIAFGSGISFLLLLILLVNVIVEIMLCIKLAQAFGKSSVFAVGLIFILIVFLPILAFGDAKYIGPI